MNKLILTVVPVHELVQLGGIIINHKNNKQYGISAYKLIVRYVIVTVIVEVLLFFSFSSFYYKESKSNSNNYMKPLAIVSAFVNCNFFNIEIQIHHPRSLT